MHANLRKQLFLCIYSTFEYFDVQHLNNFLISEVMKDHVLKHTVSGPSTVNDPFFG